MTEKETIIKCLKEYVPPNDYDLNDWDIIYKRRENYDKNIFKYSLSSADVYLYEDGSFFDVNPKNQPSHNPYSEFTDEENKIISVLKDYTSSMFDDLNNWRKILNRSVTDSDGITKYDIDFVTVFLDKNNNFYDISPFEIDDTVDSLSKNISDSDKLKIDKIKQYVLVKHYDLINWQIVLNRVKPIKDNLFLYPLGVMDLYLDSNLDVVDYDRCHIIDNQFWYDFNKHPIVAGEQYTYITDL